MTNHAFRSVYSDGCALLSLFNPSEWIGDTTRHHRQHKTTYLTHRNLNHFVIHPRLFFLSCGFFFLFRVVLSLPPVFQTVCCCCLVLFRLYCGIWCKLASVSEIARFSSPPIYTLFSCQSRTSQSRQRSKGFISCLEEHRSSSD